MVRTEQSFYAHVYYFLARQINTFFPYRGERGAKPHDEVEKEFSQTVPWKGYFPQEILDKTEKNANYHIIAF